jgi:hypothetical protein
MKCFKFVICAAVLFMISCSNEKISEMDERNAGVKAGSEVNASSQAPVTYGNQGISLIIKPEEPTRSSTLSLRSGGFSPAEGDIRWMVNGYIVESPDPWNFSALNTNKGDKIQAKTVTQGREIFSNIVEIKNAPPEVAKIRLEPEVSRLGATLSLEVEASDADGDEVTISYEWTKNGEPAGDGPRIGAPVQRGDKISVRITPFDRTDYGRPALLEREIKNLPPMIVDEKQIGFEGDVCTYKVGGTDPDGDQLKFSLKEAPEGMSIDPETGLISWIVPPEFKGKAAFTACVNDGQGGEAVQQFTIDIREE